MTIATKRRRPPQEQRALGVSAYERLSADPLEVNLLDARGEVVGEFLYTGHAGAGTYTLTTAAGHVLDLDFAAPEPAMTWDGAPADEKVGSAEFALLRAVAADEGVFQASTTTLPGVGQVEQGLRNSFMICIDYPNGTTICCDAKLCITMGPIVIKKG